MEATKILELAKATPQVYTTEPHYDEHAFEFYAFDRNGFKHWGSTGYEAELSAIRANQVILKHQEKCPQDKGLMLRDARDDREMYSDLRHGM